MKLLFCRKCKETFFETDYDFNNKLNVYCSHCGNTKELIITVNGVNIQ